MNEPQEYTSPTSPTEESPVSSAHPKGLFIVIVVGIILTSIVGGYYLSMQQDIPVVTIPNPVIEDNWNPEGTILLTLAPSEGNSMGIFEYNVSENTLVPMYVPENGSALTGKFVTDVHSGILASKYELNGSVQIIRIEDGNEEKLTNSSTQIKRHPSWSVPYESVIYAAQPETRKQGESLEPPEKFSVYSQEKDGTERRITIGALPALTPDGKNVVVLRNDGLYKADLEGGSSEKIWGLEFGEASLTRHFSISSTGKYIAWVHPDGKKIHVMEVTSWSPFVGEVTYSIDVYASWPVFSQNEKYLAFEEFDWVGAVTSKPRLVLIDLETFERRVVQNLDEFDITRMFVTDWK